MVHVTLPCRWTRWAPSHAQRAPGCRTALQCATHPRRVAQQVHCKPLTEDADHAPSTSVTGDNTIADIEQVTGVRVIVDNSGNARAEYLVRWKVWHELDTLHLQTPRHRQQHRLRTAIQTLGSSSQTYLTTCCAILRRRGGRQPARYVGGGVVNALLRRT